MSVDDGEKPCKPRWKPQSDGSTVRLDEDGPFRSLAVDSVTANGSVTHGAVLVRPRWPKKDHPDNPADKLCALLGVYRNAEFCSAYDVALEELEEHEADSSAHAGGRDPVTPEKCPRCADARELMRELDQAEHCIRLAMEWGDKGLAMISESESVPKNLRTQIRMYIKQTALGGLSLFAAGLRAGRLQAWPGEGETRQTLDCRSARSARDDVRAWVLDFRAAHPDAKLGKIYREAPFKRDTVKKHAPDLLPEGTRGPRPKK